MPLAKDLNDLIHRYGGAIAAAAESVLQPRHRPGDPLPDLTDIEKCRSVSTGKPFHFFVSQKEKIAGALAGLKAHGRVWMVCDCGSGKSPMSLAAAWSLLKKKAVQDDGTFACAHCSQMETRVRITFARRSL